MIRLIKALPILLTLASTTASAGILIETQSNPGGLMKVMMDGSKSRINMSAEQDFVLIDYDKKTMFVVMPEKKQIMDMTADLPAMGGKPAPKINLSIAANGAGPTIAGYSTEKFSLNANGTFCGHLFGSKKAMQTTGIAQLFESMKAMADKQREAMGGYATMIDECTRANMDFSSQIEKVGVPMKVLGKDGKTLSEIKSIKMDASFPANTFDLPEGYQTIKISDKLNQAKEMMSKHQGKMPDMQKMMQQMQQSGAMTPEAMEKMKQMMQQQGQ